MIDGFSFEVIGGDPHGPRLGKLTTPHGIVETPAFMPVATRGSVTGVDPRAVRAGGAEIVLANAFHLCLRPGAEAVRALGGLHRFMGWSGPILTDSGGFQVMSLADLRTVTDDAVVFRSPIDGARVELTPESVLEIQRQLGSDLALVLDDCIPAGAGRDAAAAALARTVRWARRSAECRSRLRRDSPMAVFGISQGGPFEDLRAESAETLSALPFDGFAVGGVSVGEDRDLLLATIPLGTAGLPADRPRYLMGVGGRAEFTRAIECGVDLFDCVLPTRNARNGQLLQFAGDPVRIKNSRYREDAGALEEGCDCDACARFSRGFLHHLFQRRELLGYTLASIHNLRVFHRILEEARAAIRSARWPEFARRAGI